jgi:CRP/FNR family transcriptional regulator, cyclic AMP receptor protein
LTEVSEKYLVEMLRSVPLFSGLKDKQVRAILGSGKQMHYDAGKEIVKEGENGVGFYLIAEGNVEVRRKGKVLSKLGKGDFFGEMSLLDKEPRSADVVAVTPVTCFGLTAWSFSGLLRTQPDISINMMLELVRRLRGTNKALTA